MKTSKTPDSVIINSVDRTLDIVLYIYEKARPVRITEVANDLGIYKSTVYRSLQTLAHRGFVEQNPETDTYWLGLKFFTIGSLVHANLKVETIIAPFAKILHEEFNEVVNICLLDRNSFSRPKVIVIHKEQSTEQVLQANPSIGKPSDCHSSAAGKCLLAFDKELEIKDNPTFELVEYTPHTITNWNDLHNELEKAKTLHYAVDCDEREMGLTCIGSPILDKDGYAIATLSIAGPTQRMKVDFESKIQRVIEVAKLASMKFA